MAIFSPRPFARILIPGQVRAGRGITQIVNYLTDVGMGYHRQTMFQDVHEFWGIFNKRNMFIDFDGSLIPDVDMMVESPLRRATNYRVFAEVDYYDVNTKTSQTRTVSMYMDELESLDDLEQRYIDEMEEDGFAETDFILSEYIKEVKIIAVEHNEGWQY